MEGKQLKPNKPDTGLRILNRCGPYLNELC